MDIKVTDESYRLAIQIPFQEPRELEKWSAARGQEAAFQILFFPKEECDLLLGKEPRVFGGTGRPAYRLEVISEFSTEVLIEGMLRDDAGVCRADLLCEESKAALEKGIPKAVWAELNISKGCVPGDKKVLIRVWKSEKNEGETLFWEKQLLLRVRSYQMPEAGEYRISLDLWQHVSNISRQFGVPLFGEKHFAILKEMAETLSQLGQKAVTVIASDSPWRGWGCWKNHRSKAELYEYSMVRTTRKKDGSMVYDYSVMQRYIDLCRECGIYGEIEVFGLVNIWRNADFDWEDLCPDYPENILIRCFDEKKGCFEYLRRAEEIQAYVTALEQYFIKTGQIQAVRIAADEPVEFERYRKSMELVQKAAPAFRYKTAFADAGFLEHCEAGVSTFASNFYCACSCQNKLHELKEKNPELSMQWYICCEPEYPNTFLESGLLETRFIGIMNALLGFDGFLRWSYTCWTDDPTSDIRYGDWKAGDLCLVYPSKSGGILKSLRWKALKRGIEDYELLMRLREDGKEGAVQQVFDIMLREKDVQKFLQENKKVRKDIFIDEYIVFEKARELMLDILENF